MLAGRWRSSWTKAAWKGQPTQNCTGVVSASSTQRIARTSGAHGNTSGMLPSSTGTRERDADEVALPEAAILLPRSARSRSAARRGRDVFGHGVAGGGDRGAQRGAAGLAGIEPDGGALGREVHRRASTPGTPWSARSTLPTHAAQCIPLTGRSIRVFVGGGGMASSSAPRSGRTRPAARPSSSAGRAVAGADGIGHAGADVPGEQELLDLLHRALHGGELEEDVHAVLVLLDHPLDALDLALDAAEATQRLAGVSSLIMAPPSPPDTPTGVQPHDGVGRPPRLNGQVGKTRAARRAGGPPARPGVAGRGRPGPDAGGAASPSPSAGRSSPPA